MASKIGLTAGWVVLAVLGVGACTAGKSELGGHSGHAGDNGEAGESSATGGSGAAGGGGSSSVSGGKASLGGKTGTGGKTSTSGGATSSGGAIGSAGAGGSGPCACPSEPLTWITEGFFSPGPYARLDCSGFSRFETIDRLDAYACSLPNDRCYGEWNKELDQVLSLLETDDVKLAFAMAPISYGQPIGPDDSNFRLLLGDKAVIVYRQCHPDSGCNVIPANLQALVTALQKLERRAAMECSPECLPTPPRADVSCEEQRFFWTEWGCKRADDRACEDGYATEAECAAAHRQCNGLYETECMSPTSESCPDPDDYCGYTRDCGRADMPGRCLPKPREACEPRPNDAPVCGCDGESYPSLCEAARAGTGVYSGGICN